MPRISAGSVPEHVARQEAAVIEAAARLFAARGVGDVTLGDIAAEVGLARNSLYRYFPDKGHLLAAWFRRELAPLKEAGDAVAVGDGRPVDRLDRWVQLQLDYLTAPEHKAMFELVNEVGALPPDVRAELADGHQVLYASLGTIVADGLREHSPQEPPLQRVPVIATLVAGLLRSAADLIRNGHDPAAVRAEVRRASHALVL